MALTFKQIKKGMVFRASGAGRQPDERIFRVSKKKSSPKTVFVDCPASFTREDQWGGMVELDFNMSMLNRLLVRLPDETSGWFV